MEDKNQFKTEKILRLPYWINFPISKASEFEKIQRLIKKLLKPLSLIFF